MFEAAACVAILCGSALLALRWLISHKEKSLAHAPIAELETKLKSLEEKLTALQMSGIRR